MDHLISYGLISKNGCMCINYIIALTRKQTIGENLSSFFFRKQTLIIAVATREHNFTRITTQRSGHFFEYTQNELI